MYLGYLYLLLETRIWKNTFSLYVHAEVRSHVSIHTFPVLDFAISAGHMSRYYIGVVVNSLGDEDEIGQAEARQ